MVGSVSDGVGSLKWFPFISREHHDDVIHAKDEVILSLQSQIAILNSRLSEPINVMVEMPAPVVPSSQVEKQEVRERKPKPLKEIDYATLDENDAAQMAALAIQEFERRPSPIELGRWYAQVRMQCQHRRRKRDIESDKTGSVGTVTVKASGDIVVSPPEAPKDVPKEILELIAAAERGT
jgi:hypothetical protein